MPQHGCRDRQAPDAHRWQPLRPAGYCFAWLRTPYGQTLFAEVILHCRGTLDRAIMQKQVLYAGGGEPNLEFVYRCLIDIAAGMDYLHSLGVINGDLKPANVLLKSTNEDVRGFTCKVCILSLRHFSILRVLAMQGRP